MMAFRYQALGKSRISTNLLMSYLKLADPTSQIVEKRRDGETDEPGKTMRNFNSHIFVHFDENLTYSYYGNFYLASKIQSHLQRNKKQTINDKVVRYISCGEGKLSHL